MSIIYRFYTPQDLPQTLELVNRIFQHTNPRIPADRWARLEAGDHVTVVAEEHDRIVGAIPFDLREFRLRPGLSIRGAFAHCVGVDETLRGLGVGSQMMAFARREFGRFCDALFVYTGGEGHPPYTFYQGSGFADLHYSRRYIHSGQVTAMPGDVTAVPLDPAALVEAELDSVYQAAYGDRGGFPPRGLGYWQRALDSVIYVQMPRDFYLARCERAGRLLGYALWGERTQGHMAQGALILELAARPGHAGVVAGLLRAVLAGAAARDIREVSIYASQHHPALPELAMLGFRPEERDRATVLAGQVLDPPRHWRHLAGDGAPTLHIWTPKRRLDLPGQGPTTTLEMKEDTLQRLLLCREDLETALESERITSPSWPLPVEALQQAFRPAPWVHHHIDWI